MTELLPCPFCGGEATVRSVNGGILPWIVEERGGIPEKYYTTCTLWCDTCGAQIEGYSASDITTEGLYERAIENCYTTWNTRAERTCSVAASYSPSDMNEIAEWYFAFSCGCELYWDESEPPNYCPNCGARVVRE